MLLARLSLLSNAHAVCKSNCELCNKGSNRLQDLPAPTSSTAAAHALVQAEKTTLPVLHDLALYKLEGIIDNVSSVDM